ncbi:hypothetical protein F511_29829 [Dorcoceras hygrometricum]|uniref:Uncharacterized protein n=1 Tax=Dorcoceras hygrometricum TaxID=472368 RepID=A0A2Z7DEB9_9LAMI|nr:hypothetical protein F511_29829 [Dorcoceras hygrometricum]
MNFVKASVIHDACESVKYDDQTSPKMNHKGKQGIGYTKPENCKRSWLKNKFEKDKEKAGSKSSVPNQQTRGSTKAKSVWIEGLTKMTDVPKDLVFDARSAFFMGGEQLKTSCKKREMKLEFRFLNDILAKTVIVKADSFDAVTHERFLMMSAIHGGVKWAETDSLQTAVQRLMYIIAKYREILLRKFLEATRQNFESGMPTIAIDLQVMDMLSGTHRFYLEELMKQMRAHKLEWIRPYLFLINGSWTVQEGFDRWVRDRRAPISQKWELLPQRIFIDTIAPICIFIEPIQVLRSPPIVKTWGWARVCTDIVQFHLFGHLESIGTHNICTDLVAVGLVVDRSGIPIRTVNNVQNCIRIEDYIRVSSTDAESDSTSSNSSTSTPIDFVNEETPDAQTSMPTAIVSSNDYTDAFAQLKASVDQISLEKVQYRFHIEKLKSALLRRYQALILHFLPDLIIKTGLFLFKPMFSVRRCKLRKQRFLKNWMLFVRRSKTINDLMEFRVQAQENFSTLTAQLSELVAYINRGSDAKNGEMSSSRGPPPPDDQNRPDGGSRSEPLIGSIRIENGPRSSEGGVE